jgi:hypothetical protein
MSNTATYHRAKKWLPGAANPVVLNGITFRHVCDPDGGNFLYVADDEEERYVVDWDLLLAPHGRAWRCTLE